MQHVDALGRNSLPYRDSSNHDDIMAVFDIFVVNVSDDWIVAIQSKDYLCTRVKDGLKLKPDNKIGVDNHVYTVVDNRAARNFWSCPKRDE